MINSICQTALVFLSFLVSADSFGSTHLEAGTFVYKYHLPDSVVFDLTKKYHVPLVLELKNVKGKMQKFRYNNHTPEAFFYNRKTKKHVSTKAVLVLEESVKKRKKVDSIFWALLSAATFYYPVKPYETIRPRLLIHVQTSNDTMAYLLKNVKNLELHIYNNFNESPFQFHWNDQTKKADMSLKNAYRAPDAQISSIRVIPCKHADFCRL